jgi:hypothetical protein
MAEKSDPIVKQELRTIGTVGNLELRCFDDTRDDQSHWVQGGLCFGKHDLMYGSCDGIWYVDEPWTDPLTGETAQQKPVIALEGTLALERGSSGNAQYQRFFHALGAVISGVIGVYYLREGTVPIRPDLHQAAINATKRHGVPYLVVSHLSDVRELVEAVARYGEKSQQAIAVINRIMNEMKAYWELGFGRNYKGDIQNYYDNRSIIIASDGSYIKYAGRNYRNFTESSQRAGHIALGEFYLAKYFLNQRFYYFLPRLTPDEITKLDKRSAKEWRLMRVDDLGKIVTAEDFANLPSGWTKEVRSFKDCPLKGQDYSHFYSLMEVFVSEIREGKIRLKEKAKLK